MNSWTTFDCGGGLTFELHDSGETFLKDAVSGTEVCFGFVTGPDAEAGRLNVFHMVKAMTRVLDMTRKQEKAA